MILKFGGSTRSEGAMGLVEASKFLKFGGITRSEGAMGPVEDTAFFCWSYCE